MSAQIITDNNLIPAGPYRVPDSCCVFASDFCGITNATVENIFANGCADTLKPRITQDLTMRSAKPETFVVPVYLAPFAGHFTGIVRTKQKFCRQNEIRFQYTGVIIPPELFVAITSEI